MDVPVLDDVTFAQLVEEAKKRIPQCATEWTDFNIHDPGITLIELLAWLTETQIFFLDQVTDRDTRKFLKLLGNKVQKGENLDAAIFAVQKDLKKPYRSVTLSDYEFLAKETPKANIVRAQAFWDNDKVKVIVCKKHPSVNTLTKATDAEKMLVCIHLDEGRLLTTCIEVIDPTIVLVKVQSDITVKPLASANTVKNAVIDKLEIFLNSFVGNWDGKGWPFGRNVYKSDVIALIESVEGVDCVQNLTLSAKGDFTLENGNIIVGKHALIDSDPDVHQINVIGSQAPCRRKTL
jgi:WD40 repeat protein